MESWAIFQQMQHEASEQRQQHQSLHQILEEFNIKTCDPQAQFLINQTDMFICARIEKWKESKNILVFF